MHFACRSFIGKPTDRHWSQYWENEPENPLLAQKFGHLFGLVSLSSSDPAPSLSASGHSFIDSLNQRYFSSNSSDLPANLLSSLTGLASDSACRPFSPIISLAVISSSRLHLSLSPGSLAFLCRDSSISCLLSPATAPASISGPVLPSDKLFLATADFVDLVGSDHLKHLLLNSDTSALEENFLSLLLPASPSLSLAAAIIQIRSDDFDPPPPSAPSPSLPSAPSPRIGLILKKLFRRRSVFVPSRQPSVFLHRRRFNLIAAVVLLLALTAISVLGYRRNQFRLRQSRYQEIKFVLDKKLSDAAAVRNLNLDSALDLARQSQALAEDMAKLNLNPDEVSRYRDQIISLLNQTGSVDHFSPDLFYDTSLITSQPKYSSLVFLKNSLVLFDPSSGRLDRVVIAEKSTSTLLQNENLSIFKKIAVNGNDPYLSNDNLASRVSSGKLEPVLNFSDLGSSLGTPLDFQSWNGAFYLLTSSTIWRFSPKDSGFNSGELWLKSGQSLPPNPVSLAINGRLWLLSQNGAITPFTRGVKEAFKSPDVSLSSASRLIVGNDLDLLAFTDSDKFVYLFRKDGSAIAKYNFGDLTIASLTLDEAARRLFVLCTDQKIYQIPF